MGNELEEIREYEEYIPKKEKIAYGFANAGNGILSGLGLNVIDMFYLAFTQIEPSKMAISWIIFAIWNAINDPLIGIIQDKTKSDLGRRVPYLRYGAPIYVICFILIWFPFSTDSNWLFFNHLLMLFIFDTMFSMIGLVTNGLPAEMALTSKERGSIIVYSTLIGALGLVGPTVLPIVFFGDNPDLGMWRVLMIVFGVLGGLMIYISSYFIKENKYTQLEETLGFLESIKETIKNKPFMILEIAIFSATIMQNILMSYLAFVMNYLVNIDLSNIIDILIIITIVAILIGTIYLVQKKIEIWGLKKIMLVSFIIGSFGFGLLLLVGIQESPSQFDKLSLSSMFFSLIFIGIGLIVNMLLTQPIMADTMDNDEILTGKRRETTYSGVNALFTKPAVSIGHASFLWIIEAFGYMTTESGDPIPINSQPASVATGVLYAFTIIPIITLLIAAVAMYYYSLDGPEWIQQKRKLQEIHVQKELNFIEFLRKEGRLDEIAKEQARVKENELD